MGDFVPNIPVIRFGGTGAYTVVNKHFDNTTAYATESFQITKQYIADLDTILQELQVPDTGSINVQSPYVPDINYNGRPKFSHLALPGGWPAGVPVAPVMSDLPVLPDIDMPVMSFSAPTWEHSDKAHADRYRSAGRRPDADDAKHPHRSEHCAARLSIFE